MKVGMYNRWLATLGGGEMYSLSIAEILSHQHEVEVVSHSDVTREDAARRFNLDLSRVKFVQIPTRTNEELKPLTGEYDLFINASFMDYIPSIAPHSAAIIFFPSPLEGGAASPLRYRFGWAVKRWLMIPTLEGGFLSRDPAPGQPFAMITSSPAKFKLPASRKGGYEVSFSVDVLDGRAVDFRVHLDDQLVSPDPLHEAGKPVNFHLNITDTSQPVHELVIESGDARIDGAASPCFRIAEVTVHTPAYRFFRSVFSGALGSFGLRFELLPLPQPRSSFLEHLDTYDALWAISEFTRSWIWRYWKRESVILFPPVDVDKFSPAPKTRKILNVGRFFAGAHNKKHLEMIRAFREMVDAGLHGWELYLVGGSRSEEVHRQYLEKVLAAAQGYPIHVLPDLPFSDLLPLYNESSIYWHASGYGEDEQRDPVKFEHFGITTVEAMAAGCVPVVIAKGGQPEIVQHGKNGFLWNNLQELKVYTKKLIDDAALSHRLSRAAVIDSNNYSIDRFRDRLRVLLTDIGIA